MHPPTNTSPRRPRLSLPLAATPAAPPPDTLRRRLEDLLQRLPGYAEDAAASAPEHVRSLFSPDGPLGALNFWRQNRDAIEQTTTTLREGSEAAARRDAPALKRSAARLDLRWLWPRARDGDDDVAPQPEQTPALQPAPRATFNLERQARNAALFALDSLTPWDYDRHDFGLTFTHVWEDVDAKPAKPEVTPAVVKMTSTIKPLHGEWKLSARTRLVELGPDAEVFGKAGLYLAGDRPAYIGVEADRVWKVPRLKGTKVFVNVNYRSSRKPDGDPVKTSLGVQQDFELWKGVKLTLRIGTNPLQKEQFFAMPVPPGSYF